ncbi:MAG TPA: LPS export ABC transporter periplasmic protein LptC [Aquabacterium sp.]|uniref:LPS export ABC transporter periplasmic protein LptC n=1 Tax=Aquabacterium sp. TaxID=1872578 RepID=UPI002E3797D4|nr:LPS export ABC transporter periplasmic protein LptC [Aquabacterium sp.]HEX5373916.1 LPS export ABC transporter periplasmic protein LptC [Aquabacterium sp.]
MKWPRPVVVLVAQFQAALPLLVLGGLAGYTWWLVQSAPGTGGAARHEPPATAPDYELMGATVERFDVQGQRVSLLRGAAMSHFSEGDRLEVQDLQLVARNPQNQAVQARAHQGRYTGRDDVVDLLGSARVVATPAPGSGMAGPLVFEGEALKVDMAHHVLSSHRPVHLSSPSGELRGSSLRHDARAGVSVVGGRVTGTYRVTPP